MNVMQQAAMATANSANNMAGYRQYSRACVQQGVEPMSKEQWEKSGSPAGP